MKKLLREPLLHFMIIGAGLFALHSLLGSPDEPAPASEEINVNPGRIQQLANVFTKTWQRPPTSKELQGLVDDFVLEEAYYRKAVAMGLDRDDTIIRRRLRQKLEFLTDDVVSMAEPTDEDLAAYLVEHAEEFRESPAYTFRQAYFNPERHGGDPAAYVAAQRKRADAGETIQGDPSLLPASFKQASRREVDGTFGTGFSRALDKLTLGDWQGPVRSGLGLHLIQLTDRQEGRLPTLKEVRSAVKREWEHDRRLENRRVFNERLLEEFTVTIDWPDDLTGSREETP